MDKTFFEYQMWELITLHASQISRDQRPTVEPEGAEHKFQRSAELHNLKYTEFYGDGDSKSFSMVKKVYQDAGILEEKKECISHLQKRVRAALHKLKDDNQGLGGRGIPTNSLID